MLRVSAGVPVSLCNPYRTQAGGISRVHAQRGCWPNSPVPIHPPSSPHVPPTLFHPYVPPTLPQNILLTYERFNQDLGYVQGMNDLASPLLCAPEAPPV